ncbi:MAG: hypothetical protein SGPRY_007596 [Prymnesium sp.]
MPPRDPPSPPSPLYYSFPACPGFRVLLLDCYDVSLLSHPPGSAAHMDVLALLREHNPNPPDSPEPLLGLEGDERRWGPEGGGIGAAQLDWLSSQLAAAHAASERVVILSRLGWLPAACEPEALLFNYEEVQARVDARPAVVALVLFGGDGKGGYARDMHGDAFGVVRIFEHSMQLLADEVSLMFTLCLMCAHRKLSVSLIHAFNPSLCHPKSETIARNIQHSRCETIARNVHMRGRPPDKAKRPQGWPAELSYPIAGGTIVAAAPGGGGNAFGLLWQM